MNNNRYVFSNYLGYESGSKVRRRFDANVIKKRLLADLPLELQDTKPTLIDSLIGSNKTIQKQFDFIQEKFFRLEEAIQGRNDMSFALRSKAALDLIPFFISSQHLIHSVCGNWNNESRYAMTTLRVHASDVSVGQPHSGRIDLYREMLRRYSLSDTFTEILHSGSEQRISDGAFNFPASLIILGHFPESLTGEILGANLLLRHCGVIPPFRFIAEGPLDSNTFLDLGNDPSGQPGILKELSSLAVSEFLEPSRSSALDRTAVLVGYHWARVQLIKLCENLANVLEQWLDPREAARQLIHNKSMDACQYHEKTKLNNAPMQTLLHNDNTIIFLDQLAASGFIKQGKPELSLLLNKTISPQGKMFRIFNNDDINILNRWIKYLPYKQPAAPVAAHLMWEDEDNLSKEIVRDQKLAYKDTKKINLRDYYYRLLHIEISLEDELFAQNYIKKWLARATKGVISRDSHCVLPKEWHPGILKPWLEKRHDASNKSLDTDLDLPSKEDVISDILSLAPLTMIDGSWLIGFTHPKLASSNHGFKLFETFYDELGNGIEYQNHPVIYRELLQIAYGDLPATSSWAFAMNSCFRDEDFELPNFWLSIGRYPQSYTPEILGLNLAMELSGVGGGYKKTHNALVKYKLPTMFVDLHNTIDNISTGHSAWAASSIDSYMSSLSNSQHPDTWHRIRVGFMALNPSKSKNMLETLIEKMRSIL